jgi:hypothetical protein
MKNGMRPNLFFSVVLLALGTAAVCATPASAQSVCLHEGSGDSPRCDYSSMQQCQATASGGLGYCEANPFTANASYGVRNGLAGRR